MTSVTPQHSSFVAVSAQTTWHLCVSHSYLVDIICGCCESVSVLSKSAEDLTVGEMLESAEDSIVNKFNTA